jgi:hypothetical protein
MTLWMAHGVTAMMNVMEMAAVDCDVMSQTLRRNVALP